MYLLSIESLAPGAYERMEGAYAFLLAGAEHALSNHRFLAGDVLSIADLGFLCDVLQFFAERRAEKALAAQQLEVISKDVATAYPRVHRHLTALCERDEFRPHLGRLAKNL